MGLDQDVVQSIIIAIISGLLGAGGIGGGVWAYITRNRRLEQAKADKAAIEVEVARYGSLLEESTEFNEMVTRVAKDSIARHVEEVQRIEARYEKDIDRLETRYETDVAALRREIDELRRDQETLSDRLTETETSRDQYAATVERLTLEHSKYKLILEAQYYTMVINRVTPTINPVDISTITMGQLRKTVGELRMQAKDMSNFQEFPSQL